MESEVEVDDDDDDDDDVAVDVEGFGEVSTWCNLCFLSTSFLLNKIYLSINLKCMANKNISNQMS